jgi:hypothetical protein
MDVKNVIARGSREIDWDPETSSAIARMIQNVQIAPARPRWLTRRKLLIVLPAAALVAGALTAGGISLANSLTYPPDAIVSINYTAADGSEVSCEVAVTATSGPAKQFIKEHDWSDVSSKVQQDIVRQPTPGATPGSVGSTPRSAIDIIDEEIPANLLGDALLNFATSCK